MLKMENAKTLILNNKQKNNFKAILNLKISEPSSIKFFNINAINKNFALGIKQKEEVLKIPLEIKDNNCSFNLPKNFDTKNNFFCAVVDVTNAFCPEIILSGSANEKTHNVVIENAFIQSRPEKIEELYEEEKDEQIESIINKNLEEDLNTVYYDNCSKCKYRQAFYEGEENSFCCELNKKVNVNKENVDLYSKENFYRLKKENKFTDEKQPPEEYCVEDGKEYIKEDKKSFYCQIKPQIDILFSKNKKYDYLENIIANSKWIKVNCEGSGDFYILGLIFDDDMKDVEYISYGVPSQNNLNPPEELKDYAQWLSVNFEDEKYLGYWLVYQEAKNGETIKVKFN